MDGRFTDTGYPIDFGDDNKVVYFLIESGALKPSRQQYMEAPQNRHVVAELGSKIVSVVSRLMRGFMEEGQPRPRQTQSRPAAVAVAKPAPASKPGPIVYYAPLDNKQSQTPQIADRIIF